MSEVECERVHVSEYMCVRVCVYELVIALTQDKTIREMFKISEVMHF